MLIKTITLLTLAAALVAEIAVGGSTTETAQKKTPIVEVIELESYPLEVEEAAEEQQVDGIDCELIVTPNSVTRVALGSSC